jgi:hypothetical protein
MGTRANIIVNFGSTKLVLYRHWDGYPAETGKDLAINLKACGNNCSAFIANLLSEKDAPTSFRDAVPVYEITTDVHGDVEWIYRIVFRHAGDGQVKVGAIHCGCTTNKIPAHAAQQVELGTIEEFVALVNTDIKAMNARITQLKKQPQSCYADADLIEEVL